jgi:hypothetical protein
MKKVLFIAVVTALLCNFNASAQEVDVKSGLLIGAGAGNVFNMEHAKAWTWRPNELKYNNPDVNLGYRFRLQPVQKPFFYDLDLVLGLKRYTYWEYAKPEESTPHFERNYYNAQLAFNLSMNYRFYDKWYAGVGIAPTLNRVSAAGSTSGYGINTAAALPSAAIKFDMPITAKVGYSFKHFDVAFQYNYGLFNVANDPLYLSKAKTRNWQIQLFIPF